MRVGRLVVAVVVFWAAAVLTAVPVTAYDDRPALEVTPTSPLDLDTLSSGDTRWGEITVRNRSGEASAVRLTLGSAALPQLPGRVTVTVSRDEIVVWTGPVRRLTANPVLPGRLAAGSSWELDVRVTASPRVGDVEVLGEQATAGGAPNRASGVTAPQAADGGGGVALSADALDPGGHDVSLRVQLLSYGLLTLGVLWLLIAFRRDGGTPRGRRTSADPGR